MRVCVTGGRDYRDRAHVYAVLDRLHREQPITLIIHGNAHGADMLATHWAFSRQIDTEGYQAEWSRHGPHAGPIRNRIMLAEGKPDLVVAFPSDGPGTLNCVTQARKLGITVMATGSAMSTAVATAAD